MRGWSGRSADGAPAGRSQVSLAVRVETLVTGQRCFCCGGPLVGLPHTRTGSGLSCPACGAEVEDVGASADSSVRHELSSAA